MDKKYELIIDRYNANRKFIQEIKTCFEKNNIPMDQIAEINFLYFADEYHVWFQDETIIIAFIDKLMQVNPYKYKEIITKLHETLIMSIKKLRKKDWAGINHSQDYFEYLLYNTDLTKLRPTQDYKYMYVCYYYSFYNLYAFIESESRDLLDDIIDNNKFTDDVFRDLYKVVLSVTKYCENGHLLTKRTIDQI